MAAVIKLSNRPTDEFWEIPVVYEDEHLLALSKPPCLLTSPDRYDAERSNLMKLLHRDIERGAPWAKERKLDYLMNAHRLDFETSGVILLGKTRPTLIALANLFGSEKPRKTYAAFVVGSPKENTFTVDAPIAPHPVKVGLMKTDYKRGKKSRTDFVVRERFDGYTLLECHPITGRTHQIRVHLWWVKLPILGDKLYGGPPLNLSRLKRRFHLKEGQKERPLISTVALHAEQLIVPHPVTGAEVKMQAEWPHGLTVALKYLRRYAPDRSVPAPAAAPAPEMADEAGPAGE